MAYDPSQVGSTLQQYPLKDLLISLAEGIAEAQARLDKGSMAAALKLADETVTIHDKGGKRMSKSLLELGFLPTFYHFQSATIRVSVSITMKVEEQTSQSWGGSSTISSSFAKDTYTPANQTGQGQTTTTPGQGQPTTPGQGQTTTTTPGQTTTSPGQGQVVTTTPGKGQVTTTTPGQTTTSPGQGHVVTTTPGQGQTTTSPGQGQVVTTTPGQGQLTTTNPGQGQTTTTQQGQGQSTQAGTGQQQAGGGVGSSGDTFIIDGQEYTRKQLAGKKVAELDVIATKLGIDDADYKKSHRQEKFNKIIQALNNRS